MELKRSYGVFLLGGKIFLDSMWDTLFSYPWLKFEVRRWMQCIFIRNKWVGYMQVKFPIDVNLHNLYGILGPFLLPKDGTTNLIAFPMLT